MDSQIPYIDEKLILQYHAFTLMSLVCFYPTVRSNDNFKYELTKKYHLSPKNKPVRQNSQYI